MDPLSCCFMLETVLSDMFGSCSFITLVTDVGVETQKVKDQECLLPSMTFHCPYDSSWNKRSRSKDCLGLFLSQCYYKKYVLKL